MADAGGDCRRNPSRETKFSGANGDREIFILADYMQDWQPFTRLIPILAICVTIYASW